MLKLGVYLHLVAQMHTVGSAGHGTVQWPRRVVPDCLDSNPSPGI